MMYLEMVAITVATVGGMVLFIGGLMCFGFRNQPPIR